MVLPFSGGEARSDYTSRVASLGCSLTEIETKISAQCQASHHLATSNQPHSLFFKNQTYTLGSAPGLPFCIQPHLRSDDFSNDTFASHPQARGSTTTNDASHATYSTRQPSVASHSNPMTERLDKYYYFYYQRNIAAV